MKRLAYILIAILLIVGLVGIAGCGREAISPLLPPSPSPSASPEQPPLSEEVIRIPPLPPPPPPPDGPDQATWGKSRTTPVALGYGLTYADHKLSVMSTPKRFDKIGLQSPETGKTWLVFVIRYECYSPCDLDVECLRVEGSSSRTYEPRLDVKTGNPLQSSEYYGVTTVSGYIVYEIDQTETGVMLIWECAQGVERFFEVDLCYERKP